jgi:DNA-binding response OmpR family regulator
MKRALVVEDNEAVRELIVAFVKHTKKFGEVDAVESGEEALKLSKLKRYNLITLDLALIKMTGVDTAIEIRKIDKDVVILGITGYGVIKEQYDLSIAGFNWCYTKPIDYEEFFDFVTSFDF